MGHERRRSSAASATPAARHGKGRTVWTEQNPLSRAGNLKTPMLVTVGERDYRVPMNNAIQLWSALQRMKVPAR